MRRSPLSCRSGCPGTWSCGDHRGAVYSEGGWVQVGGQVQEEFGEEAAGGGGQADASSLVAGGVAEAAEAGIRTDDRKVVRSVGTKAAVRPYHWNVAQEREQPDRLPGQLAQHSHPDGIVEPDPLPARAGPERPGPRRLDHR